ncbi:MAG: hypothetical protein ACR2G4_13090 [Pyrinomonadaceae bacterium]
MTDNHHFQLDKLTHFSARLDELFSAILSCGQDSLSPDVADEVAATAGEIMLLLANHGGDKLVRGTLEDARRLREVARTLRPGGAQLVEVGVELTKDVARIIREEKRAA